MTVILFLVNVVLVAAAFLYLRRKIKKVSLRTAARLDKIEKELKSSGSRRKQNKSKNVRSFGVMLTDGSTARFQMPLPDPAKQGPFFALGPHKSGTVLMNGLLEALCQSSGMPYFDLPGEAFKQGIDASHLKDVGDLFFQRGICFAGFRTAWLGESDLPFPPGGLAMVLLRDPRDMLVSLFFSVAKSHTIPEEGKIRDSMLAARDEAAQTDIDSWVIQHAEKLRPKLERWADWIDRGGIERVRVFRYEDIIFNKRAWIRELDNLMGLRSRPEILDEIADRFDIRPDTENENAHIRSVAPGNYREKLRPDTILRLNDILHDAAGRLGYQFRSSIPSV